MCHLHRTSVPLPRQNKKITYTKFSTISVVSCHPQIPFNFSLSQIHLQHNIKPIMSCLPRVPLFIRSPSSGWAPQPQNQASRIIPLVLKILPPLRVVCGTCSCFYTTLSSVNDGGGSSKLVPPAQHPRRRSLPDRDIPKSPANSRCTFTSTTNNTTPRFTNITARRRRRRVIARCCPGIALLITISVYISLSLVVHQPASQSALLLPILFWVCSDSSIQCSIHSLR